MFSDFIWRCDKFGSAGISSVHYAMKASIQIPFSVGHGDVVIDNMDSVSDMYDYK